MKLASWILLSLAACTKRLSSNGADNQKTTRILDCIELIKQNKFYWYKDSAGTFGFRHLYADKFLRDCNFKGSNWKDISAYFGKPNVSFIESTKAIYRYRLTNFSEYWGTPGNMYLEVIVEADMVTKFEIVTVDG